MTSQQPITQDDLHAVGAFVASTLSDVLTNIKSLRDAQSQLSLNKSLASRLLRASRAADPLKTLTLVPSAEGLRLLAQRLREHHRNQDAVRVDEASARLAQLTALFPHGATGLAVAVESLHSNTARTESEASQVSFRCGAGVYGVVVEQRRVLYALMPTPSGIELAILQQWIDVRRVKPGVRYSMGTLGRDASQAPSTRQLNGSPFQPSRYVVPELSSGVWPDVEVSEREDRVLVLLPKDRPRLGESLTLGTAVRNSRTWQSWQSQPHLVVRNRLPVRTFEFDVVTPRAHALAIRARLGIIDSAVELTDSTGEPLADCLCSLNGEDLTDAPRAAESELFRHMQTHTGWHTTNYRHVRFALSYPPIGTEVHVNIAGLG